MKIWILLLLSSPCFAASLGGRSTIDKVKVFNGRASVHRTQVVNAPKGAHTIWFRGVTPLVDRDSLKGTLGNKTAVRILGVRVRDQHLRQTGNVALAKLETEHESLREQQTKLRQQIKNLTKENQQILELFDYYKASFSGNLHNNKWTPAGFQQFLKLTRGEHQRMHGKWKSVFLGFLELEAAIEKNTAQRQEMASPSDQKQVDLALDIIADKSLRFDASITYLVPQAQWNPAYDLRLKGKQATVEQYALVSQNTGEDWTNVQLELSHSRTALRPDPPTLSPYQLSFRKVEKVQTVVSGKSKENATLTLGNAVTDDRTDQDFSVPGKQTVRDGMAETKLFLASRNTAYQESLSLMAGKLPRVFQRGQLANPFAWKMDRGPLNIFSDGQFLQKTLLDPTPKGAEIALNTGMDDRIGVTRNETQKTDTAGLISKRKIYKKVISSQLENRSSQPVAFRVWEQVPVSELDDVKVTWESNLKAGRKIASLEKESWHSWPVELGPGETKKVEFTLQADVPADMGFSW